MDPRKIREEAKRQAERVAAAQAKAEEEKQRRAEEELALSEGGRSRTFAYYCSGHGFGHATRVTALALHLLSLPKTEHVVKVVTNAPAHVFAPVTSHPSGRGSYRNADVDAGVVQPKAYDVDREATYEALKGFIDRREARLKEETKWLRQEDVDCVLVDATFLPCKAAERAGIPSVIVSNFTFDSCYSYLSAPPSAHNTSEPIPPGLLEVPVALAISDYASSSLLLRLPGAIPLPSYDTDVPLPATTWVDLANRRFTDEIVALLDRPGEDVPCNEHPHTLAASTPSHRAISPSSSSALSALHSPPNSTIRPSTLQHHRVKRRVVDTPLIVRPAAPEAYSAAFRTQLLQQMGVPADIASDEDTKVLLVSFGGQSIPKPQSPPLSRTASSGGHKRHERRTSVPEALAETKPPPDGTLTPAEIGQPPSAVDDENALLPPGWIALVTGLSASSRQDLPPRFYAPVLDREKGQDIYVPDLTACVDIVLGKLGYGTCSETVSTRTPFIYVPRPLFVEEYGLKRLMQSRGIPIEMSRSDFESGTWSPYITEAWQRGGWKKTMYRNEIAAALEAGRPMAKEEWEADAAGFIQRELDKFLLEWDNAA